MLPNQDTQTESPKKKFDWTLVVNFWQGFNVTAKTLVVLMFIINNVALALYGFGLISPDIKATSVMGAIAAAYAVVILFTFVNGGVKNQTTSKRKK